MYKFLKSLVYVISHILYRVEINGKDKLYDNRTNKR